MVDFSIKEEAHWFLHNVVGHPVAGILWGVANLTGALSELLDEAGNRVHNDTCPDPDDVITDDSNEF